MQNEENLDSDQNDAVKEQPSSATASDGDKRSSSSGQPKQTEVGERLERLEKMLSSIQSGKDRAIAKTQDQMAELREQFGNVTKLMKSRGISEDEAFDVLQKEKEEAEFRSAILEVREILKSGGSVPAQASGAKVEPSVAKVLEQYPELDANDPDVVAKVLSNNDPVQAELAALRILNKRTQTPSPTAAGIPTGTPSTPPDEASKIARLAELQKTPTKHKAEIDKLIKELGW